MLKLQFWASPNLMLGSLFHKNDTKSPNKFVNSQHVILDQAF